MKRKLVYCALMVVLIISVLFVCGCGDSKELAGKASAVEKENSQVPAEEKIDGKTDQTESKGKSSTKVPTAENTSGDSDVGKLIQEINELDEITLDSHEQLESIRARYDALSEKDKNHVNNYEILTKAEEEYRALKEEESKLNCTVWITKSGECYHLEGCRSLKSKYDYMTQKEAIDEGYEPCSKCITSFWLPKYWYNRNEIDQ